MSSRLLKAKQSKGFLFNLSAKCAGCKAWHQQHETQNNINQIVPRSGHTKKEAFPLNAPRLVSHEFVWSPSMLTSRHRRQSNRAHIYFLLKKLFLLTFKATTNMTRDVDEFTRKTIAEELTLLSGKTCFSSKAGGSGWVWCWCLVKLLHGRCGGTGYMALSTCHGEIFARKLPL